MSGPVVSPGAERALEELNEILRLDGGQIRVTASTSTSLALELDVSQSECPECIVGRDMMLSLLQASLANHDPDVRDVDVFDPREQEGWVSPSAH